MTTLTRINTAVIRAADLPLDRVEAPVALAVITGVEGASYRPVGAAMVLGADGGVAGNLSSGCIDADVVIHARRVVESGRGVMLRYGTGSPFLDLSLPCGGGLDILVMPLHPGAVREVAAAIAGRQTVTLYPALAGLSLSASPRPDALALRVLPDVRFAVFGRGPEAQAFSRMTHAAGYDTVLVTDGDADGLRDGLRTLPLHATPAIDAQTAVLLFFHDHDLEPEILRRALASPAFYIGAQGSCRAARTRLERLRDMGVSARDCDRVRGPIGLIPRARDPRILAASVLAEVLSES